MTCEAVVAELDQYLDDALPAARQLELHTHLVKCAACSREYHLRRIAGEVIRHTHDEPALPNGDAMADAILARVPAPSRAAANAPTPSNAPDANAAGAKATRPQLARSIAAGLAIVAGIGIAAAVAVVPQLMMDARNDPTTVASALDEPTASTRDVRVPTADADAAVDAERGALTMSDILARRSGGDSTMPNPIEPLTDGVMQIGPSAVADMLDRLMTAEPTKPESAPLRAIDQLDSEPLEL